MVSIAIDLIVVLASLYVLLVVLKRRRIGLFILAIPILFIVYGVLSFMLFFHRLKWDQDRIPIFSGDFGQNLLASISNYSLAIAYWIFAFQYLRTSLILPKLLVD